MKLREKLGRLSGPVGPHSERAVPAEVVRAAESAVEAAVEVAESRVVRDEDDGDLAVRAARERRRAAGRTPPARPLDGCASRVPPGAEGPSAPPPRIRPREWGQTSSAPRAAVDATMRARSRQEPALCRVLTAHEEDHRHGGVGVLAGRAVAGREVALLSLDPALTELDFARAVYIDTETTGLAGGSGTLPFLIGVAWFEGTSLHVEQLLLPKRGARCRGCRLRARVRRRARVRFNARLDWPLLRTSYVMNRRRACAAGAPRLRTARGGTARRGAGGW